MNRIPPLVAIGLALVAVCLLAFILFRSTQSSNNANDMSDLLPKPRPGSPSDPPTGNGTSGGRKTAIMEPTNSR